MSDESDPEPLGELRVSVRAGKGGDNLTSYTLKCDRLAAGTNGVLYVASVVGPSESIKGFRAALNSDLHLNMDAHGISLENPNPDRYDWQRYAADPSLRREDDGYGVRAHPIGYGHHHALILSRAPGVLTSISPAAVYAELSKSHYTTPILRSWTTYLMEKLKTLGLLKPLACYNCQCARITAGTGDLDKIVSEGIAAGVLRFAEHAVV